ncbi:FadR/GntR family transcriptional regulator [Herbiconiux ginsengi]|uniref:Transcriptional regulator, GntR family n=1 Tax=Herbiconiux ginsengi TaxID=381665 RepID=A0A1H3U2H9_9MICO|nr:FadR/GntR family transcriptional regulator [Herbiconiux ginsengi]SDZ56670.1 transcriptional regulator, GntR family [Herbiconiux ginsengi]
MSGDLQPIAPIERLSATTEVARRLLDYIRENELGSGSKLPSERILSDQLRVTRSTLREALAALDLLGVIVSRQGSGNYLADTPSELLPQAIEWGLMLGRRRTLDLAEARQHIEVAVATLAARRATPEQLTALTAQLAVMDAAQDRPDDLMEADIEFHIQIARIADNSVLTDILTSVRSLLRIWIRRGLTADQDTGHNTIREHQKILEAITARDEELARQVMTDHMRSAYLRLEASFQEQPEK